MSVLTNLAGSNAVDVNKWLCSMIELTFIILLIIYVYIWIQWKFSYWRKRKIPYFKPSIPFGNITFSNGIQSLGEIYSDFYKKAKNTGLKYAGFYMSVAPVFVPIDLDCIKQVLIKDFPNFQARGFYHNERDQPMSANLFTVDGPKWRMLRNKFSPVFTSGKIKFMCEMIVNCEKQLSETILKSAKSKSPIDVKDLMSKYTADTISLCAFGIDVNSFSENPELHKIITACVEESTTFLRFGLMHIFPNVCRFFKMGLFVEKYLKYFGDLIANVFEQRKKNLIYQPDFLQLMKEIQDQNIPELNVTLTEVQAQCLVFLLGGFETAANALAFLFLELAENSQCQEKLRREILEVCSRYERINYEALKEMKYLDCVVNETLRMYPPVPLINRRCTEDYVLPNGEILEKGTNIVISNLAVQRDPEYFPNPDVFNPDRFAEQNKTDNHRYTHLAFGDGPRNCIGRRFGLIQMKVAASHLVKKFKFSVNKNMDTARDFSCHFVLMLKRDIILDVEEVF